MKEGKVYISGYLLDESAYKPTGSWDMEEITLKQGEFFIMPDDRENGLPDAAAMRVKQEQAHRPCGHSRSAIHHRMRV